MLARPYHPADAKGLDLLLHGKGITHQAYDDIIVVGMVGQPTGVLVYRAGAFVHELECGVDFRARLRAEALSNYAIAQARAKLHQLKTAILLVKGTNVPMLRWARNLSGMVEQSEVGDAVFTLTPP
jgi:hypothetical protein